MREFNDTTAPHQIPLEAYGTAMRICTNSAELLERIEPMLPPGWQRQRASPAQHRLGLLEEDNDIYSIYQDAICVHDSPGREYALMMMESQIEGYVALNAPGYIFIHAGVVSVDGRAIVMPGLSFAGKTTLVHALVQAGAVYFSDEFAALDEQGRVVPYPRRLSLRSESGPAASRAVEELGGVAGTEPVPVGMVIAARYRAQGTWEPRELTSGEAALLLLEHAVAAQARPQQAMRHAARAVEGAVALEGERGQAGEFAALLLDTARTAV